MLKVETLLQTMAGGDAPHGGRMRAAPLRPQAIKDAWAELAGFQPLRAEPLDGCRMIDYALAFGPSVAGVAVYSTEEIHAATAQGNTPIWYNFNGEPDQYKAAPFIRHQVASGSNSFSAHNAFSGDKTYFIGDTDYRAMLSDMGSYLKEHEVEMDALKRIFRDQSLSENERENAKEQFAVFSKALRAKSDAAEEYCETQAPQPLEPVFLDTANKRVLVGKFQVIETSTELFNPQSSHYYQTLLAAPRNSAPPVQAMVATIAEFEKAQALGMPIGLLKLDGFYKPGKTMGEVPLLQVWENSASLTAALVPFLAQYHQPEMTIRYVDFFAPEHDRWSGEYQQSLEKRAAVYEDHTKAILEAVQQSGYAGTVHLLAPNIHSYAEAERIHQAFEAGQAAVTGASRLKVSYCSKVETLDAAHDIAALATHFDVMFEFGDLVREYYQLDRTDAGAIHAFAQEHGFNPFKTTPPEFVRWTEGLVKTALNANPQCHITFAGEQLVSDFGLISLAQKYEKSVAVCIKPEAQYHAATLFAYQALGQQKGHAQHGP